MLKRFLKKITTKGQPLIEINIHGFFNHYSKEDETYGYAEVNINEGDDFKALLVELYKRVLNKDKRWHFFIEGTFNHLRVSPEFEDDVIDILISKQIDYKDVKPWKDSAEIVEKNKNIFEALFHNFSLLGLGTDKYNATLADRVIHCFYNMQYFSLKEARELYSGRSESIMITMNAIYRSYYQGAVDGAYSSNKKHSDDIKDLKKRVEDYGKAYDKLFEKYDRLEKKYKEGLNGN